MAIEVYIPTEARFGERRIEEARVLVLFDAQAIGQRGSMTTPHPLDEGTAGGPLVVVGRRNGKVWEITLPEIAVRRRSALGFEFDIQSPLQIKPLNP